MEGPDLGFQILFFFLKKKKKNLRVKYPLRPSLIKENSPNALIKFTSFHKKYLA